MCNRSSVSGIPYCPSQYPSTSKQNQHPAFVWTSTAYTSSNCTDSGKAYRTYYLNGTSWSLSGFCATTTVDSYWVPGYTEFGSVRCSFGFRKSKKHSEINIQCLKSECYCFKGQNSFLSTF